MVSYLCLSLSKRTCCRSRDSPVSQWLWVRLCFQKISFSSLVCWVVWCYSMVVSMNDGPRNQPATISRETINSWNIPSLRSIRHDYRCFEGSPMVTVDVTALSLGSQTGAGRLDWSWGNESRVRRRNLRHEPWMVWMVRRVNHWLVLAGSLTTGWLVLN